MSSDVPAFDRGKARKGKQAMESVVKFPDEIIQAAVARVRACRSISSSVCGSRSLV